jgi:hypothetical protein
MRNTSENKVTSVQDVLPAIAALLQRHDKETFTNAPAVIRQMFDDILDTDSGDNMQYRQEILITLRAITDLGTTLQPFPQEIIWQLQNPPANG